MAGRILARLASVTQTRPVWVLAIVAAVTVMLFANTRNLRMRTDLSDLMGGGAPETRLLRDFIQQFGYGNRFFIVVEAAGDADADAQQMEAAADRLVADMRASGLFTSARAGLSEAEMLRMARYFVDNFPAFADPARQADLAARISPDGVRTHVRQAAAGLLTPFSTMGPDYFALDPLGLMTMAVASARSAGEFAGFDFEWGSGGRFFSKDHRGLLVIAEPRQPATDYEFSVQLMGWVRSRVAVAMSAPGPGGGVLTLTPVGAHAYAEQNRERIQRDTRVASLVSVAGNLLLCLLVYRWMFPLLLTILPTALAVIWTTGLISTYPGEINLISMGFVAIIVGLGDDQVTYFFTRVPQEMSAGHSLADAIRRTYVSTGKSVLFCILTTSTGTLALAFASFKGLAELGLVLTVGLLMLLVHTLFTVPALMHLVWRAFPVKTAGEPFRVLPGIARRAGRLVTTHPRWVLATAGALLVVACAAIPALRVAKGLPSLSRPDDPAEAGQRLLATRFGLEGAPTVLLLQGSEQDVLDRAARIETALMPLRSSGQIRAVLGPTDLVPSVQQQHTRRAGLSGIDWSGASTALLETVAALGLDERAFAPAAARLRQWGSGTWPLATVASAQQALPAGVLDTSIRRLDDGRYVAAVTLHSPRPDAIASLPPETLEALQRTAGPFVEFSYDKIAEQLQAQIVRDSRTAFLFTVCAVVLIVALLFRSLRAVLLVLLPIAYATLATVGVLVVAGHQFSGMAFAAFPLIVGIGIDNSIHLVRRHLERPDADAESLLAASGAALIQTNLTTIVGFGALLSASFPPLVELGLVTSVGMAFTLLASIFLIPAVLALRQAPTFPG